MDGLGRNLQLTDRAMDLIDENHDQSVPSRALSIVSSRTLTVHY